MRTRARLDPHLAMTVPFDVRDFCNAMVWDEHWKSDTESHVGPMFQIAAGGLPHLASRPRSSLDRSASQTSAFCELVIPFLTATYLLRQNRFIEGTRSASISLEANPSLRIFVGRETAWLDHSMHMGGFKYKTPPGLDSRWIRGADKAGYAQRVLDIIERLRHTQKPLSPRPSFDLFARSYHQIYFSERRRITGTFSLKSIGNADQTDTG